MAEQKTTMVEESLASACLPSRAGLPRETAPAEEPVSVWARATKPQAAFLSHSVADPAAGGIASPDLEAQIP